MTKTEAMTKMKEKGADDALNLRGRASTMDGTAIIAEESKVPISTRRRITAHVLPVRRLRTRGRCGRLYSRTTPRIIRAGRQRFALCGGCATRKTLQRLKHG